MKSIKKILFGITLILFGFFTMYVSVYANWGIGQVFGLFLPVAGLVFAILGYTENSD